MLSIARTVRGGRSRRSRRAVCGGAAEVLTDYLEMRRRRAVGKAQDDIPTAVGLETPDLVGVNVIAELALQRDVRCAKRHKHLIHGRDRVRRQEADGAFQNVATIIDRRDRIRRDEEERTAARACT